MDLSDMHPTAVIEPESHLGSRVYVGPMSYIGSRAEVGAGTKITGSVVEGRVGHNCILWRLAHVMRGAEVGDCVMLGQNVLVADGAKVGDRCRVQNNTCISRRVTIESDCYIGAGVMFCNSVHPNSSGTDELVPITVKHGVSIGCNVCLIGQITIGSGATIGAGAVVTKDVPTGATVVGMPAKEVTGGR